MKMRWKWLLLLSLISISFVLATSEDSDVENINNDDNYDENYDESTDVKVDDQVKEEEEDLPPTEIHTEETLTQRTEEPSAVEQEPDEDTVDVEPVAVQKAKDKGKYMNYDDYMSFNLDQSDSNYDWNGESLMI
jgi:hypothetical protein